jgi:uncharacterized protein YbjT (DUF2867 family)
MSRVAIFGATSRVGQELVSAALRRELEINAVVTDARKMTRQHEAITTIQVDLVKGNGVEAAVAGCHLVVWAIFSRDVVVADGIKHLAGELATHRIPKRLVFISRLGVGSRRRVSSLLRGLIPGVHDPLADLSRAEAILKAGALHYVIVRPAGLTDGGSRRRLVTVAPGDPVPGPISPAELAEFVIGMIDDEIWPSKDLVVGSQAQA